VLIVRQLLADEIIPILEIGEIMALTTNSTIVGVFDSPQKAQRAVMELKSAGFGDDQVGVLSRGDEGHVVGKDVEPDTAAGTGAATGAAAGAGLGALWGLGILAGVLPGIGPAIVGGTLGVLLSSAAAGAAAVGIAGALAGLGVPEDEASYYEGEFKSGRTLVTVKAGAKAPSAQLIIERNGGQARRPETARV
jgi:hypothetical protein